MASLICYGCGQPITEGLSIDMVLRKDGKETKVTVHIRCFGKADLKAFKNEAV